MVTFFGGKPGLEKAGYLVRDAESAYLDYRPDEDNAMNDIVSASVTYRLAFGPNAGQKALTLQTVPASDTRVKPKAYTMTPYRVGGRHWAQRLKRVFAIEIEKCEKCGGHVRIISSIEDPDVIAKILKHLGLDQASQPHNRSPKPTEARRAIVRSRSGQTIL